MNNKKYETCSQIYCEFVLKANFKSLVQFYLKIIEGTTKIIDTFLNF